MAAYASTAAVLDAMRSRIEALVPVPQFADDDRFRVQVDVRTTQSGSRACLLSALAAVRKFNSGRTCTDWESQVELTTYYTNVPVEAGQHSVMQRALKDAEDILADLYTWGASNDVVIQAELAPVLDDGQGELVCTRILRVQFQRT